MDCAEKKIEIFLKPGTAGKSRGVPVIFAGR